jgi:hypothetical protein
MLMLHCFLLLALFFVLLAALVSHRAPPLCICISCIQALYHSFCFLLVAEGRSGRREKKKRFKRSPTSIPTHRDYDNATSRSPPTCRGAAAG